MNNKSLSSILVVLIAFAIGSCKTHEKLVYFQEGDIKSELENKSYTPIFKTDDLLSIIVTAENPETVIPFNLPVASSNAISRSNYSSGIAETTGYLVDETGNIAFPVIGNVSVVGLSRSELTTKLQELLGSYLNDPIVQIGILNYKVTVLGDVANPGTFKIPNERITILEAVGLAGDLNITGNRKNIVVIRDDNGEKLKFIVDLTSNDIFSSPAYYLSQNDIVYIEPNGAARSNSTFWKTSGSIFISTAALIITTISVILK